LIVELPDLPSEELAYRENRINAVIGHLNVPRRVENSTVLKESEYAAGRDDLGFAWVPTNPEDGA
jgi:hypothetical protein